MSMIFNQNQRKRLHGDTNMAAMTSHEKHFIAKNIYMLPFLTLCLILRGFNFFLSGSTHESASCVCSHNLHDHGLEHKYKSERDKNIKQKKKNLNVM